ncbi:MAG TPA: hypothetical protein VE777_03420 [Gaiellales bacterium]|jgi:hypothetical protein|nr:hypothetical protein [Gaiellales bacterium]
MRWEYHVAAVGGEASDVAVDLVDVLNALGAQGWELATALPLRDADTPLLFVRREIGDQAPRLGVTDRRSAAMVLGGGARPGWWACPGSKAGYVPAE